MDELPETNEGKRDWLWLILFIWIGAALFMVWQKWAGIQWFALGDTDDNLRMQQVRDLLNGQGWYDLRQHRLDPPRGADIHWSRLVDLPIAGLMLLFRPIFGGQIAEKIAVTVAPMLPLLVTFTACALTVRRLIAVNSWIIAVGVVFASMVLRFMYLPLRIDHHGWQLAMVAVLVAGLADPQARRGGITVAVATALSLTIGMEMLPYLAAGGAALGLRWAFEPAEAPRLRAYAVALGIGVTLGFVIFASEANRLPRCDALSPVWLSTMLACAGAALILSYVRTENLIWRLAAGAVAAIVIGGFYVTTWPQCTSQLEGFSPELKRLWFDNVREVRPIYTQNKETIVTVGFSGLFGILGALFGTMRAYRTPLFAPWLSVLALSTIGGGLLMWQTRAGPAVQMLAVPGLTAFGWALIPWVRSRFEREQMGILGLLGRVLGTVGAFALISGLAAQFAVSLWPEKKTPKVANVAKKSDAECSTIPAHQPIAKLPKATIFTFADLSPRLIVLTHHSAIAGPYHRNEPALLDVHRGFRATPAAAEAMVRRHGATYVMICPGSSESSLFSHDAPNGFYAQLAAGKSIPWLDSVALPKGNPFMIWRVKPVATKVE